MPFGIGRKKDQPSAIQVTLIDASTNRVFATTELPPEELPATFELSTTMHVGTDDWRVEQAEPLDRAGYVAAGRLSLVLSKVETIDPSQILFSLPTLEDALPPMRERGGEAGHEMHEDDWRQREFVARRFVADIDAEFEAIRKVRAEQVGVGFERVHVRSRVPEPLDSVGLTQPAVEERLGGIDPLPLIVGGALVLDGFALPISGGAVYGRVVGGRLAALGLDGDADPEALWTLAVEHDLLLVDWIRAEIEVESSNV